MKGRRREPQLKATEVISTPEQGEPIQSVVDVLRSDEWKERFLSDIEAIKEFSITDERDFPLLTLRILDPETFQQHRQTDGEIQKAIDDLGSADEDHHLYLCSLLAILYPEHIDAIRQSARTAMERIEREEWVDFNLQPGEVSHELQLISNIYLLIPEKREEYMEALESQWGTIQKELETEWKKGSFYTLANILVHVRLVDEQKYRQLLDEKYLTLLHDPDYYFNELPEAVDFNNEGVLWGEYDAANRGLLALAEHLKVDPPNPTEIRISPLRQLKETPPLPTRPSI